MEHKYLFSYAANARTGEMLTGQAQIALAWPFAPRDVGWVRDKIQQTSPVPLADGSVVIASVWKFES